LVYYLCLLSIFSILVYLIYKGTIQTINLVTNKNSEKFRLKENMTPQKRWNRSARYLKSRNYLLPEDKQLSDQSKIGETPPDSNLRGDYLFDFLLKKSTLEGNVQTNASPESIETVGIDTRTYVTSELNNSPEVQKGTVEEGEGIKDYVNSRINPKMIQNMKLSDGNTEGGISSNPEGFKVKRKDLN
jgi:hypothetical protein